MDWWQASLPSASLGAGEALQEESSQFTSKSDRCGFATIYRNNKIIKAKPGVGPPWYVTVKQQAPLAAAGEGESDAEIFPTGIWTLEKAQGERS